MVTNNNDNGEGAIQAVARIFHGIPRDQWSSDKLALLKPVSLCKPMQPSLQNNGNPKGITIRGIP